MAPKEVAREAQTIVSALSQQVYNSCQDLERLMRDPSCGPAMKMALEAVVKKLDLSQRNTRDQAEYLVARAEP